MDGSRADMDGDAVRWEAVRTRDTRFDGSFVYAVRSTGVYCRPSCPSRPARPENVCFFGDVHSARNAGFRACQRCRPDDDTHAHAHAIRVACETICSADAEPSLGALASAAGLSQGHFQRVFKAQVGLSPKQYALAERRKRLRAALTTAPSVTQAIYEAGYGTSSRAYADATAIGLEPRLMLSGAGGETLRFATASTSLGEILVAASPRGLCFVEFGDPEGLRTELGRRFPRARLERADEGLVRMVHEVVALIDEPKAGACLPLDIRGTSFQERVWRALTEIAPGQTISYSDLARRIGQPKAARAVAKACASNSIAVVVPCHRVVRESGELSGYKWGIQRKQALLERERSTVDNDSPKSPDS